MRKRQLLLIIILLFIALSFIGFLGSQILIPLKHTNVRIIGLLFIIPGSLVLSFIISQKVIIPYLEQSSVIGRILYILGAIIAGFYLVFSLPLTIYPNIRVVHISATGQKAEAAESSEVWLAKIYTNEKIYLLKDVCSGDWEWLEDKFVSRYDQPSSIVCYINTDKNIVVQFGMHPWAGIVHLELDGQNFEYNLFSADGGIRKVELVVNLTPQEVFIRGILIILNVIALGTLLLTLLIWFATRKIVVPKRIKTQKLQWLFYALIPAICWCFYLLIFWPGLLSPDTVDQLTQIYSGQYNDWHPIFHTLTISFFLHLWGSIAVIAIVQILFLSGLVGVSLAHFEKRGMPKWIAWFTAIFIAFSPSLGLMNLTLWKDVAYSIALLALTILLLKIIESDAKNLRRHATWIGLGVTASLTSLFRHNGYFVVIGIFIFFVISYYKHWRFIFAAGLLAFFLVVFIKGPLYQWIGVEGGVGQPPRNQVASYALTNLIRYHKNFGTQFEDNESQWIDRVSPASNGVDQLAWRDEMYTGIWLALKLTFRNPATTTEYLLNRTSFIFRITQPPDVRLEFVDLEVYENSFGIIEASIMPGIKPIISKYIDESKSFKWDWLFWRNAFWMFVLSLSVIIAAIRTKNWKYLLLIAPVLLNALPFVLLSGGHLSRYILPTLIMGPLFSGYFLTKQE